MKIKYIITIVSIALMAGGCSSKDEVQQDGLVPIRLSAKVEDSMASHTRAGTTGNTTQDTELLAGQTVAAYIKEKNGDWLAQPVACTVTSSDDDGDGLNDGNLTYSGNVYYPMDGTPVTIYAVHPSYSSAAVFTVSSDQTDADNYAGSDLCYSKTAEYTRSVSSQLLTFKHLLSKIIVNVDVDGLSGSPTVSNLKLWAKTQTSLTYPVDNTDGYTLGTAATPAYIAMNEGAAAIIPPQTTSAAGDVRITFDVSDVGPFAYDFPASTNFSSNTQYEFTVTVGNQGITVTTSIQDWTSVNDASIQFFPPVDIKKNPLWYVAEKNVDYTAANGTKTWDGGTGTFSFADDYNGGYYLTWKEVMEAFCYQLGKTYSNTVTSDGAQTTYEGTLGAQCKIAGYHLPVQDEWRSIVPGLDSNDIFGFSQNGDPGNAFGLNDAINCVWGYNASTRSGVDDKSYWHREDDGLVKIVYALRYLGTPYCSVWKYELRNAAASNTWDNTDYGFLRITSRLIDDVNLNNSSNFSSELSLTQTCSDYISDYSWESHFTDLTGLGEYSGNDEVHGAVRRTFYARGYNRSGTNGSTPDIYEGQVGYYPSATEWSAYPDDHVKGLWITSTVTYTFDHGGGKEYCWTVRLFRDRSDYMPSKAKTTIPLATTSNIAVGDIVCSDGSIYAAATAAADIAAESKTPIGIIVFVNDGNNAIETFNTVGNVATEKGRGRYDTKSLGRALVLCLKNSSTGAAWRTSNTAFGTLFTNSNYDIDQSAQYFGFTRTVEMNSSEFPAAQSAYNYSALVAPTTTTGWFFPSVGQWRLIMAGLTDYKYLNYGNESVNTSTGGSSTFTQSYLAGQINTAMSKAGAGTYDAIKTSGDDYYWVSSEESAEYATHLRWTTGAGLGVRYGRASRTTSATIRPVLAF